MATSSEKFITQMKLRELKKQRSLLLAAYDKLDQRLTNSAGDSSKLQTLYYDLRQIYFAGHALHPEVTNLQPLLYGIDNGYQAATDTISFWRERLEKELASGRLCSEIVFIFSALLEEWTQENSKVTDEQESRRYRAELLKDVIRPLEPKPAFDPTFLEQFFEELDFGTIETNELMQKTTRYKIGRRVENHELKKVLEKISRDQYHSPGARGQAKNLLLDELLVKEFADALTIILSELESWNWAEEGITLRAAQTPSKWRLFLNEDLPTACLVEILGIRWQKVFEEFFNTVFNLRLQRLGKATLTRPPTVKVEETLKLFRQSFGLKPQVYSEIDLWDDSDKVLESDLWEDPASMEEKAKLKLSTEELLRKWVNSNSLMGYRASLKADYRDLSLIDSYGVGTKQTNFNTLEQGLAQVNAELRLARSAFPNQPLYILKADLKNYYPDLPHSLLLEILGKFGLNKTQLEFFRRYLEIVVRDGAEVVKLKRGVPNHRRLSDLLGELVLLLLDYYLKQQARVQLIRTIDDITLIAASPEEAQKAWQALERFCSATGLVLNSSKCGAVAVGGKLPAGLPTSLPVWSMVTLDEQGQWQVDSAKFESYLEQARQQVLAADSLIARVEVYNNCLNYLVKALAIRLPLDKNHRESIGQALLRFQNNFFGDGRGMVEELQRLIRERFQGQNSTTLLPDGWLHWPITAGGLSLNHPMVLAATYNESFRQRGTPVIPEERLVNWQRRQNGWYNFYRHWLTPISEQEPESNQVMETLVMDFIDRGGEISMGHQYSLSAYWRWILYIYGPQILDRLGTFRFLITELVPARLITQKYRQGLVDNEETVTGDEDEISF